MNKHSAAIILPYYGTFPNYFPLWLKSAGANASFTFMIFTDIDMSSYNIPPNVQVHAMTLEEIRQRAAVPLHRDPVLSNPYKVCDYRPLFGLIFADYLSGYDFWGFCDSDVIFGDMGKYITDEKLDRYDRFYRNGHFQLFRNTLEINRFALHKLPYWNISYRDIYKTSAHVYFEEMPLVTKLFSEFTYSGGGQYYLPDFADLYMQHREFMLLLGSPGTKVPAFRWRDGKVTALAVNGDADHKAEYLYLHLEKRSMKFTPGLESEDSFMIIPNEFVKDHELTAEEIHELMTPDHEYEQAQFKKYKKLWWDLFDGNVPLADSIRYFLSLDTAGKIIRLKTHWNRLLRRRLSINWW